MRKPLKTAIDKQIKCKKIEAATFSKQLAKQQKAAMF